MSLPDEPFEQWLAQAAGRLAQRLPTQATTPGFYLHFGADYPLPGLFDSPPNTIPLDDLLPGLPQGPNLDGTPPALLAGLCHGVPVLAAIGNRRVAEGHGHRIPLFPTALAAFMGIRNHLFLDTAVSLSPDFKIGKWGMLTDFACDFSFSPLEGLHHLLPTPFPDLSQTLDQAQNAEVINALAEFGDPPRLCTYHGIPGFHLPTPAEANRARRDGGDFLGHDLVLHLILAHAWGCRVSALALAGLQLLPGSQIRSCREEMLETGRLCSPQLQRGLRKAIREMADAAQGYKVNLLPDADADELLRESIRQSATRSSPLKAFLKRRDTP